MDFNKIKKLFVVEDDSAKNTKPKTKPKEETKVKPKTEKVQIVDASKDTTSRVNTEKQSSNISAQINPKILQNLSKAIEKADLPGEDYLEYIQAVQSLKDLPLSDEMKFKTAFSTLSTRGLTYAKILESADYYLKILENEKTKFYEAFSAKSKDLVNKNTQEIANLQNQNKKKAEQIAKLTAEIEANNKKVSILKNKVQESEVKLKTTESEFNFTYEFMASKIKSNIEKVKQIKE